MKLPVRSPVPVETVHPPGCNACKDGIEPPFPFTMAFQPIVNCLSGEVFAYEALVRGLQDQTAAQVMCQVTEESRYAFDQSCRVAALTMAKKVGLIESGAMLSINFLPGAVYSPAACIKLTLATAQRFNFPLNRLMFEITEAERVRDHHHLLSIVEEYKKHGFKIALDDLGSGYSGLNLLASLHVDIVKLDAELTRDIHRRPAAQAIVRSLVAMAADLGAGLIAEGIETIEEYRTLRDSGITLMQGYLFARPGFERLPAVVYPENMLESVCARHPGKQPELPHAAPPSS